MMPFFAVVVAFKEDLLAFCDVLLYHMHDSDLLLITLVNKRIDVFLKGLQRFCHDRVQRDHCISAVSRRTNGAELKFIPREREWRGTVTIGIIEQELRYAAMEI